MVSAKHRIVDQLIERHLTDDEEALFQRESQRRHFQRRVVTLLEGAFWLCLILFAIHLNKELR